MTIRNKVTGKTYPITESEWKEMQDSKRDKLFTVEQSPVRMSPLKQMKIPTVPPEVQRVNGKKQAAPPEEQNPENNA